MSHPPEREIGRELAGAMHNSTGSYELVIAAIAAAALGFWIDYSFGLVPLFTLIFAVCGFIGAGYSIFLNYQAQMETENAARTSRRSETTVTERSAPTDPSVLRANATCAAEPAGRGNT